MSKIAIVQPLIPHYREEFFNALQKKFDIDIYVYREIEEIKKMKMKNSNLNVKNLKTFDYKNKIRFYNIFPLLSKKYNTIIVTAEVRTISVWLLLFLKKIFNKKVILWGHGISTFHYIEEEFKMPIYKIFFHRMADKIWLYTEKEKDIWEKYININKITVLNNSIDTKNILDYDKKSKHVLKEHYNIKSDVVLIFSARFNSKLRRIDLLINIIKSLDKNKFSFIIIGDGAYKPDFSNFENVYDFGATYDFNLKSELFTIADIYLQPAWLGLSIVEAMAYGLPVFTLRRSNTIKQGVEYGYISSKTGYIAKDINELLEKINELNENDIKNFKKECKEFIKLNINIENMNKNAITSLKKLINE